MDAVFPNILIAQALGRWGNFVNQEAYGAVVDEAYYNGWPSFIKEQMHDRRCITVSRLFCMRAWRI